MKRVRYFLVASSAAVAAFVLFAAPPKTEKSQTLDEFMLQKRMHTQACLDGLMYEDFEKVIIAGESVKQMKADKRWNRIQTEEYNRQSENLQTHAQCMVDAARRKDLDAAMDGYLKTLRTCFECHKYVRTKVSKHLP